mmetsp:Transcript_40691/g.73330  ORF Transcript_40691/g.73330 Transcript_40691/m.73330 type:complete len:220 (-) Transcript_40691:600-1259(-)
MEVGDALPRSLLFNLVHNPIRCLAQAYRQGPPTVVFFSLIPTSVSWEASSIRLPLQFVVPRSKGAEVYNSSVRVNLVVNCRWKPLATETKADVDLHCRIQEHGLSRQHSFQQEVRLARSSETADCVPQCLINSVIAHLSPGILQFPRCVGQELRMSNELSLLVISTGRTRPPIQALHALVEGTPVALDLKSSDLIELQWLIAHHSLHSTHPHNRLHPAL